MNSKLRTLALAVGFACTTFTTQADDLLQIYQQALTSDPILQQAKADRDAVYEAIEQERASLLPQINASLGYSNNFYNRDLPSNENDGFRGSLSLSQNLYNQAAFTALDLSKQVATQAELRYNLAEQDLALRVAQAYFNVLSAQDNLAFVQANKRAIERQLEQTKQRFAVGLTAITDVHEAQAQFDLATANEINAQNTLENSFEALREITGLSHDTLSVLDTARFSPSQPSPATYEQWLALAEDTSLSLLIQRVGVEIAKEQVDLAKTGSLPTVTLNAAYNQGTMFDSPSDNADANIGIQLNVPLYTGGRIDSQVKQASFAVTGAQQGLEQAHRTTVRNLRAGLNNVNAAISSITAFEQSVVSAESALKATEAGFEVGTRTIVDVLNATQNLYNAKQQLSSARYDYIIDVLSLKQAAGTLSEEDISLINQGLKAS